MIKKTIKRSSFLFILLISFLFFGQASLIKAQSDFVNPVVWKTRYVKLASSNFYIQIGDQTFYGDSDISVQSDPGTDKTTLETSWMENGVEMRFFIYFQKTTDNSWEIYDLRTYNGQASGDWIYYDLSSNPVSAPINSRYFSSQQIFTSSTQPNAKIYCQDCAITAFTPSALISSDYGYSLDFQIGLSEDETITISTDPSTGYGVNASLYDSTGQIVADQSNLTYRWQSDNPDIATISSQPIAYEDNSCYAGVLPPCPSVNGQIGGKNPGVTRIRVDVLRKEDDVAIASGDFDVKVIDHQSVPPQEQEPVSNPDVEDIKAEIGLIKKQIDDQQQELSGIRKILESILDFIRRLFPTQQ